MVLCLQNVHHELFLFVSDLALLAFLLVEGAARLRRRHCRSFLVAPCHEAVVVAGAAGEAFLVFELLTLL
jgi:hypothetical protein